MKPETQRQLQALSPQAQTIVDGWVESNPAQVKAWEADGSLLQRAKEAQDQASDALAKAKQDQQPGMPALAPHEAYEIYGGPNLKL